MPNDMFFNTGIATYIWILSNNKPEHRKGKVQLINASKLGDSMRKSLGSKRKYLNEEQINAIVRTYGDNEVSDISKIFDTTEFGYRRVTIERPLQLSFTTKDADRLEALTTDSTFAKLKDNVQAEILLAVSSMQDSYMSRDVFNKELQKKTPTKLTASNLKLVQKHLSEHNDDAVICKDSKGKPEASSDLRDYENIPLSENINEYFDREVKPHVPLAWIDIKKTDAQDGKIGIVGYEIPFNRHFYEYTPPRDLAEIDADLDKVTQEILALLNEVHS